MLYKAVYLHDIGKKKKNQRCHEYASVAKIFSLYDCTGEKNQEYTRRICSIIVAHRNSFTPDEDVALEAAILRLADKIDKVNKKNKGARKSYEKSKKEIAQYFGNDNITFCNLKDVTDRLFGELES